MARLIDDPRIQAGLREKSEGLIGEREGIPTLRRAPSSGPSFLEGFIKNEWYQMGPSLLGFDPSDDVREFQQEHPYINLAQAILNPTYAIPATTGLKVASKIPGLARAAKAVTSAERLAEAPVLTRGLQGAVAFAPFEAARLAGAAGLEAAGIAPKGATRRVLVEAPLELGLITGAGIGFAAYRQARPLAREKLGAEFELSRHIPDLDLNATLQERLKKIMGFRAAGKQNLPQETFDDLAHPVEKSVKTLTQEILEQEPSVYGKAGRVVTKQHVRRLENEGSPKALELVFSPKAEEGISVRKLVVKKDQFPTLDELKSTLAKIGMPEDFPAEAQFPRFVQAKTDESAKAVRKVIRENMEKVGADHYITREQDGLYVVAKKIKGRHLEGKAGDEFLVLKTHNPAGLFPKLERFGQTEREGLYALGELTRNNPLERRIPIGRFLQEVMEALNPNAPLRGTPGSRLSQVVDRILPEELAAARRQVAGTLGHFKSQLKRPVAPSLHEVSRNPRAVALLTVARATQDFAKALATSEFYGLKKALRSKSLLGKIFEIPEHELSLENAISTLSDEGRTWVSHAFRNELDLVDLKRLGASEDALEFYRRLGKLDRAKEKEVERVYQITEAAEGSPLGDNLKIARKWRGSLRLPIHDAEGHVIQYASGNSRNQVLEEAKLMQKLAADNGLEVKFNRRELEFATRDQDLRLAQTVKFGLESSQRLRAVTSKVGRFEPGRFSPDLPGVQDFSKAELRDIVFGNLLETNRFTATALLNHKLFPHIARVSEETPDIAGLLKSRMSALGGEHFEKSKFFDAILDKPLSPYFGAGVSQRIARGVNQFMFNWSFGFGDLGFAVVNAMTPFQTVPAEIAFVLGAPAERAAQFYPMSLVMGKDNVVRGVSVLDPWRIMWKSLKLARNPTDELSEMMDRGLREESISKKFVEAFAGEKGEILHRWREIPTGGVGFYEYMKALSQFPAAKSEEFARGLSFINGYTVGQIKGLEGEKLYQFASLFTHRTNYLYATADRARVMTGAFGSMFGLYKNWPTHYIANMLNYVGEGALHGNFGPMLWMGAGSMALAGVGGAPLYFAADGMSRLLSDKPLMDNLYDYMGFRDDVDAVVGREAAQIAMDGMYYGVPGFLGLTFQSRAAAPSAALIRDIGMLTNIAVLQRAQNLYDAAGAVWEQGWATGQLPLENQTVRDQLYRAFLPRTWYRALSFTQDGALKSLRTSNRLVSEVGFPSRLAFALGATPTSIESAMQASTDLYANQNKLRDKTMAYGEAWKDAEDRGNTADLIDLQNRIFHDGVQLDSVVRSAMGRRSKEREDLLERQFDIMKLEPKRNVLGR